MSTNPILAAVLWAGQPQFMAPFLVVMFLCTATYIALRSSKSGKSGFAWAAVSGIVLTVVTFVGVQSYLRACATTGSSGARLNEIAVGAALLAIVAAITTSAYFFPGGITHSSLVALSGCAMLVLGSVSLAAGCTVLGTNIATIKTWALPVYHYGTWATALCDLVFIVAVSIAAAKPRQHSRQLAARK